MTNINYWHMQIHPDDPDFAERHVYKILEHNKIIGLGEWPEGKRVIGTFENDVKVNDVVAIKTGTKLIALVQIIGGSYDVDDDEPPLDWIVHRRPIRVLDWAVEDRSIPQSRKTLDRCADANAETTRVIKGWHEKVVQSFKKREVKLYV